MNHLPLVSVLIPVYNAGAFINESIDSILNQTYKNLEIIIINDGSTDNSEDGIKSFKDNRIKYLKNEKNLKLIKTLNIGLQLCTGKYIARMDADDIAVPTRIEKQVAFMELNQDVVASGTYAQFFGSSSKTGIWMYPLQNEDIKLRLLWGSSIIHPTAIFKNDIVKKYSIQFQEEYLHAEDMKFWIDLSQYGELANIPKVLLNYRIHSNQITEKYKPEMINTVALILKNQFQKFDIDINENEQLILKKIIAHQYKLSKLEFENIIILFEKFTQINNQYKRFDDKKLYEEIVLKLYEIIFYSSTLLNFKYLKLFNATFNSSLISKSKKNRLLLKLIIGQ